MCILSKQDSLIKFTVILIIYLVYPKPKGMYVEAICNSHIHNKAMSFFP